MIDQQDYAQAQKIADELLKFANKYHVARSSEAEARFNINIILASRMSELRKKKTNLGHETAMLMLLESGEKEIEKHYKTMLTEEANFKSLEKILDALSSQLILLQSIAKNTRGVLNG